MITKSKDSLLMRVTDKRQKIQKVSKKAGWKISLLNLNKTVP